MIVLAFSVYNINYFDLDDVFIEVKEKWVDRIASQSSLVDQDQQDHQGREYMLLFRSDMFYHFAVSPDVVPSQARLLSSCKVSWHFVY